MESGGRRQFHYVICSENDKEPFQRAAMFLRRSPPGFRPDNGGLLSYWGREDCATGFMYGAFVLIFGRRDQNLEEVNDL